MNVLIVLAEMTIPPGDVYGYKYPPLGLACLAGVLKKAGIEAVIEIYRPGEDPSDWVGRVLAHQPRMVGFSVFIGYKLSNAIILSRLLKEADPGLPIVWGGVHPSLVPEQILSEPSVDYVAIGPGEEMIVPLARAVVNDIPFSEVPALAWRHGGEFRLNPARPLTADIASYRPDWRSFPVEEFVVRTEKGEGFLGFFTSRGCPYRCGFCYNSAFHGRSWFPAEVKILQEEMELLVRQYEIKGFLFLDDCFFGSRKRALALLSWLTDNNLFCQNVDLRIDELDQALLLELRRAGTRSIFIGVESGTDRMLRLIRKGITVKELQKALAVLAGYPESVVLLSCIVGFPTETFREMQDSIATIAGLAATRPNTLVQLNGYMPFPGTPLYEQAEAAGFQVPETLDQWGKLGEKVLCTGLEHFPGRLTGTQSKYLARAARYMRLLFCPTEGRSGLRGMVSRFFGAIAAWRLQHRILWLPADLWCYETLRSASASLRKRDS